MTATISGIDGGALASPSELRAVADRLSRALAKPADALTGNRDAMRRTVLRKLNDRGVRDDIAERDAIAVKVAMLNAGRALMEAAQELDALCAALDTYNEDLHSGGDA